jgi:hypothetical protein
MSHDYSGRLYLRQLHRAAVLSEPSSTATAKAGDIQAGAGVSKLTTASSPAAVATLPVGTSRCDVRTAQRAVPTDETRCACLAKKKPEFLVCRSCWWQAPAEVRQQIRFGALPAKRGAIRLMLDFARGRKVLRELGEVGSSRCDDFSGPPQGAAQRAVPTNPEARGDARPTTAKIGLRYER